MKIRGAFTAIALGLSLGATASAGSALVAGGTPLSAAPGAGLVPAGQQPLGADPTPAPPTAAPAGDPRPPSAPKQSERVEGSYIVDLAPGLDPKRVAADVARDYGGKVEFVYDAVIGGFEFRGPDDARKRLANDPRVDGVDPNYEVHTADTLPFASQDNAPAAWNAGATGAGMRIAILDTGIKLTHPWFSGRIIDAYAGCVSESSADDKNGHGSATASQAGGINGIAKDAKLVPIKIFPGSGTSTDWGKVACGINRAKSMGYEVINMSLAGGSPTQALADAVNQAAQNAVIVAAAGNSGGSVQYPAAYDPVLAVSGFDTTTATKKLASWSARGSKVDIGAPGVDVCGADITQGTDCSSDGGTDSTRSGTSRSSPQVAGAAAVLRAAGVPVGQVDDFLKKGGKCPNGTTNTVAGNCPSGTGTWSGDADGFTEPFLDVYGALQAANALGGPTGTWVQPTNNQQISGTTFAIRIAASDSDNQTPPASLSVKLKIGSDADFTRTALPNAGTYAYHEYVWSLTGVPDGPVQIQAKITDGDNKSTTISRSVVVDNVDDPPSVSFATPGNGATVSPTFTVTANATDDNSVSNVELLVDGVSKGVQSGSQWTGSVGPLANGSHTLDAKAKDNANQVRTTSITVTVSNIFYQQKFDTTGSTGWTVSGSSPLWHVSSKCGAPRSTPNGVYYGKDTTCQYSNGAANKGYLTTPTITALPSSYHLTVSSKRKVESCSSCTRDRTVIQVSYNGGSSWSQIYYRDGRNASSGAWETLTFTLGNASSSSVRVRFLFDTTSTTANGYFGWAIDDFVLKP